MDDHQCEIYKSALFFAARDKRPMSPVEQRFVERMREKYPNQCEQLDCDKELLSARDQRVRGNQL